MQNLETPHLDVAKRILCYVKSYLADDLMYKKDNNFLLKGFIDTNWIGDTINHR